MFPSSISKVLFENYFSRRFKDFRRSKKYKVWIRIWTKIVSSVTRFGLLIVVFYFQNYFFFSAFVTDFPKFGISRTKEHIHWVTLLNFFVCITIIILFKGLKYCNGKYFLSFSLRIQNFVTSELFNILS